MELSRAVKPIAPFSEELSPQAIELVQDFEAVIRSALREVAQAHADLAAGIPVYRSAVIRSLATWMSLALQIAEEFLSAEAKDDLQMQRVFEHKRELARALGMHGLSLGSSREGRERR